MYIRAHIWDINGSIETVFHGAAAKYGRQGWWCTYVLTRVAREDHKDIRRQIGRADYLELIHI